MTEQILPYFGGAEGEACRVAGVEAWKSDGVTGTQSNWSTFDYVSPATYTGLKDDLDAVMQTELYQTAKSYCQPEIDLYNRAAGVVCLLDKSMVPEKYNMTYGEFWGNGDVYFDGDYDLATMFSQTANFTEVGSSSSCLLDCYTGAGSGCLDLEPYLPNYGKVTAEQFCELEWRLIDNGYNEIKLCAAKAIAKPQNMTMLEYVNTMRYQASTQQECGYASCFPQLGDAILKTDCPTDATGSGVANGGGSRAVILLSLVVAWLAF